MIKRNEGEWLSPVGQDRFLYLLLLIVGAMEFVFITMESLFSYIGYYLVEEYIILPCLLFVGCCLTRKLTGFARGRLLLSGLAISWFIVAQLIHKLSGTATHPVGTVFFIYLMAFPFASAAKDDKNLGLQIIGWIFFGASMVHVFYTGLLLTDKVPEMMYPYLFWDGARLNSFWHPNINSCLFLIGIVFALFMLLRSGNPVVKCVMGLSVPVQFFCMALTNCRTTLLLTGAFLGVAAFLAIGVKDWKRTLAGAVVAVLILTGSFTVSGKIYEWHNDNLKAKITAKLEAQAEQEKAAAEAEKPAEKDEETKPASEEAPSKAEDTGKKEEQSAAAQKTEPAQKPVEIREKYKISKKTGEVILVSNNGQRGLTTDLKTFNGRTPIWEAAFTALREHRRIALWGTEDVSYMVTMYRGREYLHTHNSWLESLMRLGIPGLMIALVFTGISVCSAWTVVFSPRAELWKKLIAGLTMCILACGFLEPYLFITNVYYHIIDFVFFFCTGYLDHWRHMLKTE